MLTQPQSRTVTAMYGVSFSALANGGVPLTYQWRKNGADVVGATNRSYPIANVQPADAGVYTVTVSNGLGSVSSSNAVLTIAAPYSFTTLAGNAGYGSADGTGRAAR